MERILIPTNEMKLQARKANLRMHRKLRNNRSAERLYWRRFEAATRARASDSIENRSTVTASSLQRPGIGRIHTSALRHDDIIG